MFPGSCSPSNLQGTPNKLVNVGKRSPRKMMIRPAYDPGHKHSGLCTHIVPRETKAVWFVIHPQEGGREDVFRQTLETPPPYKIRHQLKKNKIIHSYARHGCGVCSREVSQQTTSSGAQIARQKPSTQAAAMSTFFCCILSEENAVPYQRAPWAQPRGL